MLVSRFGIAAFATALFVTTGFAQNALPGITPEIAQQIEAITTDKLQRSDAQKKIEPALLYAAREANGLPQFPNAPTLKLPQLSANDKLDTAGQVVVDIKTAGAAGIEDQVRALGGSVISSLPSYNAVRARLPVTALEKLAALPNVRTIRTAEQPRTNRIDPPAFAKRSDAVREKLSDRLQTNVGKGPTKSEAIVAHGADIVQNAGITGTGVKICVMSDGVSSLSARQNAGELPAVQILSTGQASSSGDEGTAMLELVADIAPGATLGFSTGGGGVPQMAQNIIDLRNSMNCDIIVDDLSYLSEAAFQEDVIANAVTTVVNAGAMYFSSAANSGHLTGGNSGTWEGDYVDGGSVVIGATTLMHAHAWGSSTSNQITASTDTVSLKWSDPVGAAANDYDLFIVNSAQTAILGSSTTTQNGSQDPVEIASCSGANCVFPAGSLAIINKTNGSTRALRLDTHRGRLAVNTAGSTFGHNAGVNTISVAAVPSPSNRKFNSSDVTETFSSDGLRRLFYNPTPSTTAITPACILFSCNGGTNLQKPDISAGDCNTTTTPGFIPFCGTSAAAPNAAAIAGLIKSSSPAQTNAQILSRMRATAIDIMAAGVDRDAGYGIVMADAAVNASPSSKPHDFNGDAKSDIFWRNTGGSNAIWLMNGATVSSVALIGAVDTGWMPVGQRDFDGDGKTDILWRNSGGSNAIWFMNGSTVTSVALIGGVATNWSVVGTADLNGDGKGDIIWRNTDGTVAVWLMNGSTVSSVAVLGGVGTNWSIVGTADFDGDGKGDILWREQGGSNVIWLMNGASVSSVAAIGGVSANWSVAGTADFNGDGKGDIMWREQGGSNAIWLMNGATVSSVALIGGVATNWSVASNGDYDGDGKGDILWRNTDGANYVWFMNGASVTSVAGIGGVATNWNVQNAGAN